VRQYFVAVDEMDWTYIPERGDRALTGKPDDYSREPGARGMLDPNGTTYRKALYRAYTDSTFRVLKPAGEHWAHLGALGPLLRAEVGDTIRVVFRNHATRPYSMHPHGVLYGKDAEGTSYLDGTSGADRLDDSVAPGRSHVYTWPVPERAGPASGDGSTAFWLYHSHVDEGKDINSGLIGPIIVTRRGMARDDGSPTDVDREFIADFALYDEIDSWYLDSNVVRLARQRLVGSRGDVRPVDLVGRHVVRANTSTASAFGRRSRHGMRRLGVDCRRGEQSEKSERGSATVHGRVIRVRSR
jgi:hypothetical protein